MTTLNIFRLDCVVAGSPSPKVMWTREEDGVSWHPGMDHGPVYMARNNSLIFVNASSLENGISGHYSCIGVNTAGSALERSQIMLFDPSDFGGSDTNGANEIVSPDHSQYYHIATDNDLASARIALMEKTVKMRNLASESAHGLKVTWQADQQVKYLDGYHIR